MKYSLAREIIFYASELGMNNGDYVFIMFELSVNEVDLKIKDPYKWFNGKFTATNNQTENFQQMFQNVLIMTVNVQGSKELESFNYQMKIKASQAPFYSGVYTGNVTMPWGEVIDYFKIPVCKKFANFTISLELPKCHYPYT